MRRHLAEFLRDTLLRDTSVDLAPWFDMGRVSIMVNDHIAGRANHTDALDKVLTVATAQKTLLTPDRPKTCPDLDRTEYRVCAATNS
jgi:hypothetical protein